MPEERDRGGNPRRRPRPRRRVTLSVRQPLSLPNHFGSEPPADAAHETGRPAAGGPHPIEGEPSEDETSPTAATADAWDRDRLGRAPTGPPRRTPPVGVVSTRSPPLRGHDSMPEPRGRPHRDEALDLVQRRSRESDHAIDYEVEMNERFALGDFSAALSIAELVLGRHPEHAGALRIAGEAEERLVKLHEARLGDLDRAPEVVLAPTELRWLGLDRRASQLLARVDGSSSFRTIIERSGMPRLEALKGLVELVASSAIHARRDGGGESNPKRPPVR